ncbi:MAG: hypothetical protein RL139_429 [Gemmatimonadota bacterium]|jgi:tRNA threonylcarbamoyladenosine biosynthesis protein TsaB
MVTPPLTSGLVLALDASGGDGTLALLRDGTCVADATVVMRGTREETFLPALLALLEGAGARLADVRALIVGAGPGSFTALRVIGATAKGIAEGTGCPLYAAPSLGLLVAADNRTHRAGRWFATLDALRGDRYAALVVTGADGAVGAVDSLGLVPASEVMARAAALGATPIGPDEALAAMPHARGAARALAMVRATGPVDLATWEPGYGRLAEAQVKWEAAHGRALTAPAPGAPSA